MSACEWCWQQALLRATAHPEKNPAEHYSDIVQQQERLGTRADCPEMRETALARGYEQ